MTIAHTPMTLQSRTTMTHDDGHTTTARTCDCRICCKLPIEVVLLMCVHSTSRLTGVGGQTRGLTVKSLVRAPGTDSCPIRIPDTLEVSRDRKQTCRPLGTCSNAAPRLIHDLCDLEQRAVRAQLSRLPEQRHRICLLPEQHPHRNDTHVFGGRRPIFQARPQFDHAGGKSDVGRSDRSPRRRRGGMAVRNRGLRHRQRHRIVALFHHGQLMARRAIRAPALQNGVLLHRHPLGSCLGFALIRRMRRS
jgi:hypothetical protein